MAYRKFAPITAALLARKGEATPAPFATDTHGLRAPEPRALHRPILPVAEEPLPPVQVLQQPESVAPAPPPMALPACRAAGSRTAKPKRLYVRLEDEAFQRVAIAAVKTGTTPHELLREALERHLAALDTALGDCACLRNGIPPCT
jgi:hypothetical protein